jgi:PAS domain-containing protein
MEPSAETIGASNMTQANIEELRKSSNRIDAIEFAFYAYPDSFENFFMAHPMPSWVKRTDGVMVLSNRAYERAYDIPPLDYAGTYDSDQWSEEEADRFGDLDQKAADENRMVIGVEWVKLPSIDRKQALFVCKWPVKWDDQGVPTQIAGTVMGAVTFKNGAGSDEYRT